jgi:predicted ATPase
VRSLVDDRVIAGERGAYRLAAAVQQVRVPATVRAMLAARIDRLPAEDKDLLQIASVVGTDVPVAVLAAVTAALDDGLPNRLARLQAAEFLYETSVPPDAAYTFKHALTHEVAYGSLLQKRRRALHARTVEAIEGLYPERLAEHVERLAYHATGRVMGESGRLSPPGRGEGGGAIGPSGGDGLLRAGARRASASPPAAGVAGAGDRPPP